MGTGGDQPATGGAVERGQNERVIMENEEHQDRTRLGSGLVGGELTMMEKRRTRKKNRTTTRKMKQRMRTRKRKKQKRMDKWRAWK